MALTRCKNGHFYDGRRYMGCPFCGVDLTGAAFKNLSPNEPAHNPGSPGDEAVTVAALNIGDESKTVAKGEADADGKTIGIYEHSGGDSSGVMLAGWLVCTEGVERGRDYRIHAGNNLIGRSIGMDINLADAYVSRKNHARIIYDPVSNAFFIVSLESTEVECNGKPVLNATPLRDGDDLRIGGSQFVFVAFCKEGRKWSI